MSKSIVACPLFTGLGSGPGAFARVAPVCCYLPLARHGLVVFRRFEAGYIVLCQDPNGAGFGSLRKAFSIVREATDCLGKTCFRRSQHSIQVLQLRENNSVGFRVDRTFVEPKLLQQFLNLNFAGAIFEPCPR